MAEVKWIKISTDMFSNKKIKYLRSQPNGDRYTLIWVMFLTLAGNCNDGGKVYLTKDIPYTVQMLSDESGFEADIIAEAVDLFAKLGMIQIDSDGFISISNWAEYQNVDGMEKVKEQTRNRVAKFRERQAKSEDSVTCNGNYDSENSANNGIEEVCNANCNGDVTQCNVTCNATVTQCNATDIDIDKDIEYKREVREKSGPSPVHNSDDSAPPDSGTRSKNNHAKQSTSANPYKLYGSKRNVRLTDDQFNNLAKLYPADYMDKIEYFAAYMARSGRKYANHYETIIAWAKEDLDKARQKPPDSRNNSFNRFPQRQYDCDELEKKLMNGGG